MPIRIPNRPESDPGHALAEAIEIAAREMRISPGMAAMISSHLFEQIARQLARGRSVRSVRVTGFGLFTTRWFHPPHQPHGHAVPMFIPSRGLRQEVRSSVLSSQIDERQRTSYQKRNRTGSTPKRVAQRTSFSQEAERKRILKDNFGSIELD